MSTTTYQLKYCERCGSLRLRAADSSETYCRPCEQALFHFLPEQAERLTKSRASARDLPTPDPALKAGNGCLPQPETRNLKLETDVRRLQ